MNRQLHKNCSILQDKDTALLTAIMSIRVHTRNFHKKIVRRYSYIIKSDSLSSLILSKFLKNTSGLTKTNIIISRIFDHGIRNCQQENKYTKPVSAAMVKLVRILPERTAFLKASIGNHEQENSHIRRFKLHGSGSKNTMTVPGDQNLESNICIISDRFQPVLAASQEIAQHQYSVSKKDVNLWERKYQGKADNQVPAVSKTFADVTQTEKTGPTSVQQQKRPDTPLLPDHTDVVAAGNSSIEIRDNVTVKDVISHPLIHTAGMIPETDTIPAYINNKNGLVYNKYNAFHSSTAGRYPLTEKNNISSRLISNIHLAGPENNASHDIHEISNVMSRRDVALFQPAGHTQTGMSIPLKVALTHIVRNASDLVLRKNSVHNTVDSLKATVPPDISKAEGTDINSDKEVAGNNIQARVGPDDIAVISERVYRLLERTISIEKERRGL